MTKVPATESMTKPAERLDEAVQANTAFAVNELSASAIEALEAARMNSLHDSLNDLMCPSIPDQ
jgi:hypothetical protein